MALACHFSCLTFAAIASCSFARAADRYSFTRRDPAPAHFHRVTCRLGKKMRSPLERMVVSLISQPGVFERLFRDLMGDTLLSIEQMGRRPVYKPDSFN